MSDSLDYVGTDRVREYGCVLCQTFHREGRDADFVPHLMFQSKHGWRYVKPANEQETRPT